MYHTIILACKCAEHYDDDGVNSLSPFFCLLFAQHVHAHVLLLAGIYWHQSYLVFNLMGSLSSSLNVDGLTQNVLVVDLNYVMRKL